MENILNEHIDLAHLEKLLKTKGVSNEKKAEIERLLPQVNYRKILFFL